MKERTEQDNGWLAGINTHPIFCSFQNGSFRTLKLGKNENKELLFYSCSAQAPHQVLK